MTDQTAFDPTTQGAQGAIPQQGGDAAPNEGGDMGDTAVAQGTGAIPTQQDMQGAPDVGTNAVPQQGQTQAPAQMVSYLRGDGAASPQQVKAAEDKVRQEGMDDSQVPLAVIHDAQQSGDPDTALSYLQAYRQKYDLMKNAARVAADGSQTQAPHMGASAQAASAAMDQLPDGNKVVMTAGQNGVTAAVTGPDGKATQIPMTLDAYKNFLAGPGSQFDNLMQKPVQQVLHNVSKRVAPNSYPASSGGGQVQIHAVGPGNGPGPSGVRIGSDLAHMKPLNYEPIPPATPTNPGAIPSGSGLAPVQDQNAPGAGVPQDLQPDRLVPGTQTVQKPDGSTAPYAPGNQPGGSGLPARAPGSAADASINGLPGQQRYRLVRGGHSQDVDANGQPIPDYNTQQQAGFEDQKLKNQGSIATWGVRAQSTQDLARQKMAQWNMNNWRTNATKQQIAAFNATQSALREKMRDDSAYATTDAGVQEIAKAAARIGMHPQDLLESLGQQGPAPSGAAPQQQQPQQPAPQRGASSVPPDAVTQLKAAGKGGQVDPKTRQQFDAIFGAGAAAKILGY